MKLRRILSLILALILPLSFLAACSDAASEDETTAAPSSDPNPAVTDTEETADPDARLDSGLPDADYGGYKFNIYIHNTITNDFEAEELTGEPINDAEYGRMVTVQDRGNCEITPLVVAADNRAGHTPLSNAVKAGTDDYDLACLSGSQQDSELPARGEISLVRRFPEPRRRGSGILGYISPVDVVQTQFVLGLCVPCGRLVDEVVGVQHDAFAKLLRDGLRERLDALL